MATWREKRKTKKKPRTGNCCRHPLRSGGHSLTSFARETISKISEVAVKGNMRSIDDDRNLSPSRKVSSNKTYVIPEMTVDDVLEAITDWIKKHPERMQCSMGHNQTVFAKPHLGNQEE